MREREREGERKKETDGESNRQKDKRKLRETDNSKYYGNVESYTAAGQMDIRTGV